MHDPWDSGDDSGTVFRDVILLALAGFVFITVLLLPHINPKAKQGEGSTDPPGCVPTWIFGCRRPATCRSATPTKAA
jgi:hypothetical protein